MFWQLEEKSTQTGLAELLNKEGVTLREIMDDEYVLQELKCGNALLISFLTKPESLVGLTKMCVTEPDDIEEEKKKFRYCSLASELLSADSEELMAALSKTTECYDILANFIASHVASSSSSINPLLASFFNKVFGLLANKHLDQVLAYMQSNPTFLDNLIYSLEVSAIADTLFRLAYGGVNEEFTLKTKDWLAEYGFISKIVALLDPVRSEDVHQNATYVLCELIRTLRDAQYNRDEKIVDPLLDQLQSRETLDGLLDRIVGKESKYVYSSSVTANGCAVFLTLLNTVYVPYNPIETANNLMRHEQQRKDDGTSHQPYFSNTDQVDIWSPDPERIVEKCLTARLADFQRLLREPSGNSIPLKLPMGTIESPFGAARFALMKTVTQLLISGLPEAHHKAREINLFSDLFALMFKHEWNNFLHTSVLDCVLCAFCAMLPTATESDNASNVTLPDSGNNGDVKRRHSPSPLIQQLLQDIQILKLLAGKCDDFVKQNGARDVPPYAGHLLRLAMQVHYSMRNGPHSTYICDLFRKLSEDEQNLWQSFVDNTLLSYIKHNEPDPVGILESSDVDIITDRTEDFGPLMTVPSKAVQAFSDCNEQRMMPDVPTDFGLSSDAFASDKDTGVSDTMDCAANITFDIETNFKSEGESAFEAICSQRISLYENEPDFDEPREGEMTRDSFTGIASKRVSSTNNTKPVAMDGHASAERNPDAKSLFGQDAGPPEWFSAFSGTSTTPGESWADFESEGKTTSTSTPKNPAGGEGWANFEEQWPYSSPVTFGIVAATTAYETMPTSMVVAVTSPSAHSSKDGSSTLKGLGTETTEGKSVSQQNGPQA